VNDETEEQVGMCGVTTELPAGATCQLTGADLSGATVTCVEDPHGREWDHVGVLTRDGSPVVVYSW
jgi:hypothetical protein